MIGAVIALILLDCSGMRLGQPQVMAYVWILAGAMTRMAWNLEAKPG